MAREQTSISLLNETTTKAYNYLFNMFPFNNPEQLGNYAPRTFSFKLGFVPTTRELNSEWFLLYNEPFYDINYFGFEFCPDSLIFNISATPWWHFFLMYMPFFFLLLWLAGFFVINLISVERSRIICLIMLSAFSLILIGFSFYVGTSMPKIALFDFYGLNDVIYLSNGNVKTPMHAKLVVPDYKNKHTAALLNYLYKDVRFDEWLVTEPIRFKPIIEGSHSSPFKRFLQRTDPIYFNTDYTQSQTSLFDVRGLHPQNDSTDVSRKVLYTVPHHPQVTGAEYRLSFLLETEKKRHVVRAWCSNVGICSISSKEYILPVLSGCCWSVLVSLIGCIGVSYKPNKNRVQLFTTFRNKMKLQLKDRFYYKLKMRDIYYVHGGAGCMEWSALEKLPKQKKLKNVFEDWTELTFKAFVELFNKAVYTRAPYITVCVNLVAAAAMLPLNSPATSLFFLSVVLLFSLKKAKYPLCLVSYEELRVSRAFLFIYELNAEANRFALLGFNEFQRFSVGESLFRFLINLNLIKYLSQRTWQTQLSYLLVWLSCLAPVALLTYLEPTKLTQITAESTFKILIVFYGLILVLCFMRVDVMPKNSHNSDSEIDTISLNTLKFINLVLIYLVVAFLMVLAFYGVTFLASKLSDYGTTRMNWCWCILICLSWTAAFSHKYLVYSPNLRKVYTFFVFFFYIYSIGDLSYTAYAFSALTVFAAANKILSAWHVNRVKSRQAAVLEVFDSLVICLIAIAPFAVLALYIMLQGGFWQTQLTVNVFALTLLVSMVIYFFFFATKDAKALSPFLLLLPFFYTSWLICCRTGSLTVSIPGVFFKLNCLLDESWVLFLWLWSCVFLWRVVKYCKCSELLGSLILVFYPFALSLGYNWYSLFTVTEVDKYVCLLLLAEVLAMIWYLFKSGINYDKAFFTSVAAVDSVRTLSFMLAVLFYTYLALLLSLGLLKYTTLFTVGVVVVCCMYSSLLLCMIVITDLNRTGKLTDLQGAFTGFRYLRKLFFTFYLFLFLFVCVIFCNIL